MTSDDIKSYSADFAGAAFWCKEIAYQLAVMNERGALLTRQIPPLDAESEEKA